MKIKEICHKTGLTDRTVRYYIEEGLIVPFYRENYLGRKSFDFSEQDLERLKNIATLRAFGFTVEEIKQLSLREGDSKQIIETVKKRTEDCLNESHRRLSALSALDLLDEADLCELAQKLSNSDMAIENETAKSNAGKRFVLFLSSCAVFVAVWLPIVLPIVVLVFKLCTLNMPIVRALFVMCTLLCFLPSMVTVLIFRKLKGSRKMLRIILTTFCVLCLPFGILFSSKSVVVCDHSYIMYRTSVEPTCLEEGENLMKCEKCGSFETQTVEKLAHTHTVIKVVEATCTKEGENLIKCEMCGDSQTQKVEKLAHTPVDVEEVVATCTDTGRGKGSSCSVCHTMLSEEEIIPAKGHSYKNCEIQQTCGVDGCILYECACGDSYKTNIVRATNAHDFQRNFEGIGYTCHTCGLEVVEHGNVDGSTSGDNNIVKYYITGEDYEDISRTLVIYGSGDMPDFGGISSPDSLTPGWLSSYMYAVDTVIIESGVTYIGENAFAEIYGEPSYYDGIKKFIIRSEDIQIAEYPNGDDHRVSGIKCKITFEY